MADAPLPEPGYRILPLNDGHLPSEVERVWCWEEGWKSIPVPVSLHHVGRWYSAPEPADWPALPENCRRIQITDTPKEGDLIYCGTLGWSAEQMGSCFYPYHLGHGNYARPLPEPLLTAEERVSEDLEDESPTCTEAEIRDDMILRLNALNKEVEQLKENDRYFGSRNRNILDRLDRLDALAGKVEQQGEIIERLIDQVVNQDEILDTKKFEDWLRTGSTEGKE
jgi:hypothetical protein